MADMIQWLDSIMATGVDLMPDPKVTAKEYPVFAINRGMAQNIDTVMYAAEMNKRPGLTARQHYAFSLNSIKKKKRYGKWAKKSDDKLDDLEMVKDVYQMSTEKALSALRILTKDQLKEMREKLSKGGMKNERKASS